MLCTKGINYIQIKYGTSPAALLDTGASIGVIYKGMLSGGETIDNAQVKIQGVAGAMDAVGTTTVKIGILDINTHECVTVSHKFTVIDKTIGVDEINGWIELNFSPCNYR